MAHVHDDSDSTQCDSDYNSTPNESDSDSDSTPNYSDSVKLMPNTSDSAKLTPKTILPPESESEASLDSDSGVGIVPGLCDTIDSKCYYRSSPITNG